MFTLVKKLSRSMKTQVPAAATPRRPAVEPLEGRRMCSVSPVAAVGSTPAGETQNAGLLLPAVQAARQVSRAQAAASNGLLLPAVQHTGGANANGIIAILIGL